MPCVEARPRLARRGRDAYKRSVGTVRVLAGSASMPGAAALAVRGALRAGAGLVQLVAPESTCRIAVAQCPEATLAPLPGSCFQVSDVPALLAQRHVWDVDVIGPGLGREEDTLQAVRELLAVPGARCVVDADALFALGEAGPLPETFVLTPHEGEAARLLSRTPQDVVGDREAAARTLHERTRAIVVLKGPATLVVGAERTWRCKTGSAVLAAGGTGDVLAGAVAALVAHARRADASTEEAVAAAVWAHGAAADAWAAQTGADRGMLAREVADRLPAGLAACLS